MKRTLLLLLALVFLAMPATASQHNPVLSTTSPYPGITMLGDANNSFAALLSNNAAATAPSYGIEGTLFDNSTSNYLELYSGANWLVLGTYTNTAWAPLVNGAPLVCPVSTGSANAYVVTDTPAIGALVTGTPYCFITNFSNTGSATVNFDGLGAKTLKKNGGTNLASADFGSGVVVHVTWDGTNMQVTSEIAASGGASGVTSIATTSPVCGGTITTTGTISICSQSNNTVLANISGSSGTPAATGTPVVTSWGLSGTSAASGTFTGIHEVSSNVLSLAADGADAATIFTDQGITVGSPTGGDKGAGTINATNLYVNGTAVATGSSSNGLVPLHTITCTSGSPCSSVVFSSTYITGTYNQYVIQINGLYAPSIVTSFNFGAVFSTNNGSTYLSSGYTTNYSVSQGGCAAASAAFVDMMGACFVSIVSTQPAQVTISFSNPSAAKQLIYSFDYVGYSDISGVGVFSRWSGFATNSSTTAINNVKIYDASGAANGLVGVFSLSGVVQ